MKFLRGIIRLFMRNWRYKLAAVLVSTALYGFVHFEQDSQISMRLDVQWEAVPEDRMILDNEMPEIRIVLDGPGTLLRQVQSSNVTYRALASALVLGQNLVRIDVEQLALPRGVSVRRVSPSSFEVEYVEVEKRQLPVNINFAGEVAPGFRLAGIQAEPAKVVLHVQKGQLGGATFISTTPIDLEGRTTAFEGPVDLDLAGLSIKKIEPKLVRATVNIVPAQELRTFDSFPVVVRGEENAVYELMPDVVSLTLWGPGAQLEEALSLVQVYVDVSDVPDKAAPFPVLVEAPPEFEIRRIAPELVVVRGSRKE